MSIPAPRRRLVLVFPGFEPLTAESSARRFLRGLNLSAPFYDLSVHSSEPVVEEVGGGLRMARLSVRTEGDPATETTVVVYGLDAVLKAYGARSTPARIARGCLAQFDFLVTGTFFRYLRTSWRYGLFFLFPLLTACAVAALGALAFHLLSRWGAAPALLGAALACLVLLPLADRQFHLRLVMDDWSFARDLARGHDAWLNGLLAAVNADVAGRVAAFDGDEVVFAGHSLGVVPAVGALAGLLRQGTAVGLPGAPSLGLLSVGSSLLKIALHPAADRLRRDVAEIAGSPVSWLEVQSVSDPISFYRSDPVEALSAGPVGRVRIMRVSLRSQLGAQSLKGMRFNMFRLHRQFVRPVEKRSRYSFHVMLCGSAPFASLVGAKRPGLASAEPDARKE